LVKVGGGREREREKKKNEEKNEKERKEVGKWKGTGQKECQGSAHFQRLPPVTYHLLNLQEKADALDRKRRIVVRVPVQNKV
jgi:hypothetical protein